MINRKTIENYHNVNGKIHITCTNNKQMTDEEKENYNNAISILLGNDFEISVMTEITCEMITSFKIQNGLVSVDINEKYFDNL